MDEGARECGVTAAVSDVCTQQLVCIWLQRAARGKPSVWQLPRARNACQAAHAAAAREPR
jgi:hypothetical protein